MPKNGNKKLTVRDDREFERKRVKQSRASKEANQENGFKLLKTLKNNHKSCLPAGKAERRQLLRAAAHEGISLHTWGLSPCDIHQESGGRYVGQGVVSSDPNNQIQMHVHVEGEKQLANTSTATAGAAASPKQKMSRRQAQKLKEGRERESIPPAPIEHVTPPSVQHRLHISSSENNNKKTRAIFPLTEQKTVRITNA
eukprot:CAMPEP_0181336044 /NCGR_PEP_ID=MMETSP1101-20121128/27189_1 /TAXON_ID=46948 /ORGANISM="Rhodomonas abbreviata, Strain Caron Lab Isolate" /LENGTH=197 /DNA_ID=CAMNT_0023446273 /DNA_START=50 /DNA_END=640 /DNA_ORIENTATION=-